MSALLADIDATCASLGYYDGTTYHPEPDSLQGLKVYFCSIMLWNLSNNILILVIAPNMDSAS